MQATNASRLWECAPASPRSPPRSDRRSGATLGGGSSTSPSKRLSTKRRCTYPPSPATFPNRARVVQPVRAGRHDLRPQRQRRRRLRPPRPAQQLLTLILGQLQHSLRPTRPHHPRFYELQYEFLAQD
jgi:hypothetical protein